jgi:hypothetical protein
MPPSLRASRGGMLPSGRRWPPLGASECAGGGPHWPPEGHPLPSGLRSTPPRRVGGPLAPRVAGGARGRQRPPPGAASL